MGAGGRALPIIITPDGPHGRGHHHDGGRGDHDHADDGEHRGLSVKYWPAPDLLSCEFFSSKPSQVYLPVLKRWH